MSVVWLYRLNRSLERKWIFYHFFSLSPFYSTLRSFVTNSLQFHHDYLVRYITSIINKNGTLSGFLMERHEFTLETFVTHKGSSFHQYMLSWVTQLANVVDFLHDRGVILRDLNPSNVVISKDMCSISTVSVHKLLFDDMIEADAVITKLLIFESILIETPFAPSNGSAIKRES